jgi:hypothetical protein
MIARIATRKRSYSKRLVITIICLLFIVVKPSTLNAQLKNSVPYIAKFIKEGTFRNRLLHMPLYIIRDSIFFSNKKIKGMKVIESTSKIRFFRPYYIELASISYEKEENNFIAYVTINQFQRYNKEIFISQEAWIFKVYMSGPNEIINKIEFVNGIYPINVYSD